METYSGCINSGCGSLSNEHMNINGVCNRNSTINLERSSSDGLAAQRTLVASSRMALLLVGAVGVVARLEHVAALLAQAQVVAVRDAVLLRVLQTDHARVRRYSDCNKDRHEWRDRFITYRKRQSVPVEYKCFTNGWIIIWLMVAECR